MHESNDPLPAIASNQLLTRACHHEAIFSKILAWVFMSGKCLENNGLSSRENEVKISPKNAKWPIPNVSFWGVCGLVCIEKCSQNFGTPKMTKTGSF